MQYLLKGLRILFDVKKQTKKKKEREREKKKSSYILEGMNKKIRWLS